MDRVHEELKKRFEEKKKLQAANEIKTDTNVSLDSKLKKDNHAAVGSKSKAGELSKELQPVAMTTNEELLEYGVSVRQKMKSAFKRIKSKMQETKSEDSYSFYLPPEISINKEDREVVLKQFNDRRSNQQIETSIVESQVFNCYIENFKEKIESGQFTCFDSTEIKLGDSRWVLRIQFNTKRNGQIHGHKWMAVGMINVNQCQVVYQELMFRRSLIISGVLEAIKGSNKDFVFIDEPPFSSEYCTQWADKQFPKPKYIRQYLLENVNNNQLHLKCILEPIFPLVKMFSVDNGQLEWTIENVSSNLSNEKCGFSECQLSPYFYTSAINGYRVQCCLYLNGNSLATGRFVSIFLNFLQGQWDFQLPPLDKFKHQTVFTLINQEENKKHWVKSDINNKGYNCDVCYDFISHLDLFDSNASYIRNDCIKLRIEIQFR